MAASVPDDVNVFQENWRFCVNCFSLFWNGDQLGNKGLCPSPNAPQNTHGHVPRGWDFYVPADSRKTI